MLIFLYLFIYLSRSHGTNRGCDYVQHSLPHRRVASYFGQIHFHRLACPSNLRSLVHCYKSCSGQSTPLSRHWGGICNRNFDTRCSLLVSPHHKDGRKSWVESFDKTRSWAKLRNVGNLTLIFCGKI